MDVVLPTSLVGSYAPPLWLLDQDRLRERFPPRTRARELWRVDPEFLEVLESLTPKHVILGVLDLSSNDVETPEEVERRIRRALPHYPVERLTAAPDCGMKYLSREAAFGKLESLVEGARRVRETL